MQNIKKKSVKVSLEIIVQSLQNGNLTLVYTYVNAYNTYLYYA